MNKKHIAIIAVSAIVIFTVLIYTLSVSRYTTYVAMGNKVYSVEVSDTKYLLEKGLSGHKPLKSDEGMLFVFEEMGKYGFWMKDMLFSIDIIWIDNELNIVHIEKSVSPQTYPKIFTPEVQALYVLEVSAGEAQQQNVKIGDKVKFLE